MTSARNRDGLVVENTEYAKFATRVVRAYGRRAGSDADALPALVDLQAELDTAMRRIVDACRAEGWSWSEIGDRLGITRQAAQQRFGATPRQRARRDPDVVFLPARTSAQVDQPAAVAV